MTDPLVLSISSMLVGMLLGVISSILGIMIHADLHDLDYPTDAELEQLFGWYEENYGKDDSND